MVYNDLKEAILSEWKIILCFTVIYTLYSYYTSTFDHFQKRGISYKKPTILLGNLGPRLTAKVSMHEFNLQVYNYFRGQKSGGLFEGRRPILYLFDADLIKDVTIRRFDHFVDRNVLAGQKDYLSKSLINLKGLEWKGVRSTVSPAFSSLQLRNMFPLIQYCSDQMVAFLNQYDKKEVEMKDTLGHFTLEVIGACAFGIKCDALTNENAHFVKVAEKFNHMSKMKRAFIFSVLIFMPKLFRQLNISFLNQESVEELLNMLKKTKTERKESGTKRNDFLQLLIDAADKSLESDTSSNKIIFDDRTIDAQSLLFLLGGYETTSTLLSFAVYTLATNQILQAKLRKHVNEKIKGNDVTYEQLLELAYLDAFLLETLRIYPPVARIDRVCTKKYTMPESSIHLDVGDTVAIPVYGIHMDPKIYPEPCEFRPERFLGEEKASRPPHLFLAFGCGPRNCIGQRFAMISAKLAMVKLLKNFEFTICSKTQYPMKFDKRAVLLKAERGVWVRVDSI